MKAQAILGPAVVALGVATGSLLAPQAASALDFKFSFAGVEGLIRGLQDNTSGQTSNPPTLVEVTSSPIGGLGTYTYINGNGFTVTAGAITGFDWVGQAAAGADSGLLFISYNESGLCSDAGFNCYSPPSTLSFTPAPSAASVPGPVPLLGAAAAFGYSRRLRKRIKGRSSIFSSAPFA